MRFRFESSLALWLLHLIFLVQFLKSTLSLSCDKTFTYYEEYGQNSFSVTCDGITKGYEHILENITINNEISLTLTNSALEGIKPEIFRNVRNIKILSIFNSSFEFDSKLPIFSVLEKLENLSIQDTHFEIGNVTLKGLSNLKILELRNNSLSDIKKGGLREVTNLEKLKLMDNQIMNLEDLQLCELQKLKILNLQNNKLSNKYPFNFYCRTNTKTLDFNINDQPAVPSIYQNTYYNTTPLAYDLVELDLSFNQIVDVEHSLEGMHKLRSLNLGFNKLTYIKYLQFKSLEKLEKLILKSNRIVSFDSAVFINKSRLNLLDLSHNFLPSLTVENISKLQALNLGFNNLTRISMRNLTSLKKVNLEYNHLKYLGFKAVPELASLRLAGNTIELDQGVFKEMQGLRYLYLNNNSLKNIPEKTFSGLQNLRTLDLSYNELSFIDVNTFHDLENLEILNLSNNAIKSLSYLAVEPLQNLMSLDLAANKLQYIEYDVILSKLPGLTNINIKSNLLTCENLAKIVVFLKQRHIDYTSSEHIDVAGMNQNVAGIPCRSSNQNIIVTVERKSQGSATLFNLGISIVIVLIGILTGIVTYKFYIYLKRRKYRADEFELVDE